MYDCVILVGGKGKRLKSLTKNTPKPLLKINNIPFIQHLLFKYGQYKIKKFYLIGNYKFKKFNEFFYNKKIYNIPIELINEKKPKDTAGCLFELKKKIKKDFLLLNGDSFFDIDLDQFYKNCKKNKFLANLALTKNINYQSNKKLVNIDVKKQKVFFSKKSNKINAGIYFIRKNFLDDIKNKKMSLEKDILPKLINKKNVGGFLYKKKFFIDIGLKKNLNLAKKKLNKYTQNKAVLLDRDGVLNKDKGYIYKVKDFKILNGVEKAIKLLNDKKYFTIVITNQSGIGRGFYTEKDLEKLHNFFQKKLKKQNAIINKFYFCPFHETGGIGKYKKKSFFRKPNPGMLLQSINDFNLDKKKCFMIGDKLTDKQAALRAGIKFYYKKNISFFNQIKKII